MRDHKKFGMTQGYRVSMETNEKLLVTIKLIQF